MFSLNWPKFTKKKRVLFHRDYLRFQGGHLKVWHYFNHLKQSEHYKPEIHFTKQSILDKNNPWINCVTLKTWNPSSKDIIFLAGLDWQIALNNKAYLANKQSIPVINLIQGLSHAEPNDVKYKFLSERAIRICVSPEVSDAIQKTKCTNGPIFTIPNGIELNLPASQLDQKDKDIDILILALKKPELGLALNKKLIDNQLKPLVITSLKSREEFLSLIRRARICVCLPHFAEGFYLPALEAMSLECIVVCPDCIGNRSFCIDQFNCFMPAYNEEAIIRAIESAVCLPKEEKRRFVSRAQLTAKEHSLESESAKFLDIINNIKNIW